MQKNKISSKEMKITYHGQFRMSTRNNISTIAEKRRIAYKARYEGESIGAAECKQNGWKLSINPHRLYKFYDGNIFVFVGKNRRTLATIINVAA